MSTATVTPGYTFTSDNEPMDVAKLNQLGRPTVTIPAGSITGTEIDPASVAAVLENVAAVRNHFRDPLFTGPWLATGGQTHTPTGTRFNHPEWYAVPATGQFSCSRETITPTDEHGNRFALKVTGDAANTGVSYIGQLVPAAVAGALDENVMLTFYLRNGTGDDFTPSVRVLGCSSVDDFSTLAELATATTSEVVNGQWLRITVSLDTSVMTNWRNGGAIEIVIPAGTLDTGGKSVSFAMPQLQRGTVANSFIIPETVITPRVYTSTSDPTVDRDYTEGYRAGDLWVNTTDNEIFLCRKPDGAGAAVWVSTVAGVPAGPAYIHLQDRQAQNTSGGGATSGAWTARVLNTELVDTGNHCTLAANQFTLAAGTYNIVARCPAYACGNFQARLYNATDAAVQTDGTNEIYSTAGFSDTNTAYQQSTWVELRGRFTLATAKALQIEMRVQTTKATNGLGLPANLAAEIFTEVWLTKTA